MKKLKNDQGFGLVAVLALLVCFTLVGFAGWLVYSKSKDRRQTDTKTAAKASPSSDAAKEQPKIQDPYEGWKSVRLADEGLGFRYPSDWTAKGAGGVIIGQNESTKIENVNLVSPVANGHYFSVNLMAGPADTTINLNMLGKASGSTISKLDVPGSTAPLYLVAQTGSSPDKILCMGLATTPGAQNHTTDFGILDDGGKGQHNIVMYACLAPEKVSLDDSGYEYDVEMYKSNPYYETIIKIFESLNYKQ